MIFLLVRDALVLSPTRQRGRAAAGQPTKKGEKKWAVERQKGNYLFRRRAPDTCLQLTLRTRRLESPARRPCAGDSLHFEPNLGPIKVSAAEMR